MDTTRSELFEALLNYLNASLLHVLGAVTLLALMLFLMSRLPPYRRVYSRIARLFLYEEDTASTPSLLREDVQALRDKIRNLENALSKGDQFALAEETVAGFLDERLGDLVEKHLGEGKELEQGVVRRLERTVAEATHKYLVNSSPDSLESAFAMNRKIESASQAMLRLEEDLGRERGSAATLRTVMINLFVVFNLGLLVTYIAYGELLAGPTLYTIGGSYLSLVAFIVYIVRASHFRTGVLLAIRENLVNQATALNFLEVKTESGTTSESDVEIVRMLLTNRTEREARAQHPYEIILKQVEGSNIQFRGGKMSLGRKSKKG